MFTTILIANRGEIACRVAATARRLGVRTVAVYSDADANAKHVQVCDRAVRLGPAPAKESYLDVEAIIAAAKATGAQAIHPGYGFLSENEDFAERCEREGLVFIGPPASAIAAMGLKAEAKQRMEKAGVPLVPGYHGADQAPERLARESERIGYPVLIKASAGGGGKGMRVVTRASDFMAALESCKREAKAAFGDDAVLIEKYLSRPRHIEVQIFADKHGNCVYLHERDCSVQRRHQKVLEEAPAPGLSPQRRAAMGQAAVSAAQAVGYVGAGTVEMIAEGEQFYFMEMNTRLQVEHPVTEAITGVDLVEWQLRVAAGERLPLTQSQLKLDGHSLEARVYAESPEKGFLPSTGRLAHLRFPEHVAFTMGPVRVDSGVRQGDEITPHYDPMIAKVIVWGPDRQAALVRMAQALAETQIVGLSTNTAFLQRLVSCPAFADAELDTGLIANNQAALFPPEQPPGDEVYALAVAALLAKEAEHIDADPWSQRNGWRLNHLAVRTLELGGRKVELTYGHSSHRLFGERMTFSREGDALHLMLGKRPVHGTVVAHGGALHVFHAGQQHVLAVADPLRVERDDDAGGKLAAPMPGKIVQLLTKVGQAVEKGAPLLVMEAMKMEHTITAPAAGQVEVFLYAAGDQVAEGAELLRFAAKST